jgi:hypothetical protein
MSKMTDPITVGEFQDACAAARKNLSSLSTAELTDLRVAVLTALRGDLPTPVVFDCGIPTEKIFGIKSRLDALEVHVAAADLKGADRMVAIFEAENKNSARGAAPKPAIGFSKFGRFRNANNSVNLAEVLDAEAEAAK